MKTLILVNKTHPISKEYKVDLCDVEGKLVAKEMAGELTHMLEDAREKGFMPILCSGYRSFVYQRELLTTKVDRLCNQGYNRAQAQLLAEREIMPEGCSEHHTGLAVDIVSEENKKLEVSQEESKCNQWFRKHCMEYGFILRYPKDKEEITQVAYEPWHFRFVGIEVAKYLTKNKMTLEELILKSK